MFGSRRRRERQDRLDAGMPGAWLESCADRFPWFASLDADRRERWERRTLEMVMDVSWEPARDFRVTDDMALVVAAQAQLLVVDQPDGALGAVHSVVVHPTTILMEGEFSQVDGIVSDDPTPILGEAVEHGPLLFAWDEILDDLQDPTRGRNVVLHECAHVLDHLNGVADGTPPMRDAELADRWVAACTEAYDAVVDGRDPGVIDPYGGVNPAEFFAVATEAYFCEPHALWRAHPELSGVLADFYGLDPREWSER